MTILVMYNYTKQFCSSSKLEAARSSEDYWLLSQEGNHDLTYLQLWELWHKLHLGAVSDGGTESCTIVMISILDSSFDYHAWVAREGVAKEHS